MSEFVKCFQCGEYVLVDFKAFEKIKCSYCSLEIPKKFLTWCECSHAGIDHIDMILAERCRLCDCTNFIHVQDHVPDDMTRN